jgi:hypothetical protein
MLIFGENSMANVKKSKISGCHGGEDADCSCLYCNTVVSYLFLRKIFLYHQGLNDFSFLHVLTSALKMKVIYSSEMLEDHTQILKMLNLKFTHYKVSN